MHATISDLREHLDRKPGTAHTAEYIAKMMHPVPDWPVADREAYILDACRGRTVVHLGSASGDLHGKIKAIAVRAIGVDINPGHQTDIVCDLETNPRGIGQFLGLDLIVCGELLEHLANPGNLLAALRVIRCPVLITVPNAFSSIARKHMHGGTENVNRQHVCWYSATTLTTLLTRYHFEIVEGHWYNGEPMFAEGLIVLAR